MNILFIDDLDGDTAKNKLLDWAVIDESRDVVNVAKNLYEGLSRLEYISSWPDLIVLDCFFPEKEGKRPLFMADKVIDKLNNAAAGTRLPYILIVSGNPDIKENWPQISQWLIERVVSDVLPKTQLSEFTWLILANKVEQYRYKISTEGLSPRIKEIEELKEFGIITQSDLMIKEWRKLKLYARFNESRVFVYGETGTGKELFAKAFHKYGQRKDGPCKLFNCGSHESTSQAVLFGHVAGAYTSASKERKGLLHSANNGVLIFDDVHNLPKETQAALLRAIENRSYSPLGDHTRELSVDIQFVFTANEKMLSQGENKPVTNEFYYRVHSASIELPSLNDRIDDIDTLAKYILAELAKEIRPNTMFYPHKAFIQKLKEKHWPGNIRMLKDCLKDVCYQLIIADGDHDLYQLAEKECTYIDDYFSKNLIQAQGQLGFYASPAGTGKEHFSKNNSKAADPVFSDLIRDLTNSSQPLSLTSAWEAINEAHLKDLISLLTELFATQDRQLMIFDFIREKNARQHENPKLIHFLKVILCLFLCEKKLYRQELIHALGFSEGQAFNVLENMGQLVEKQKYGAKNSYCLSGALVEKHTTEPG